MSHDTALTFHRSVDLPDDVRAHEDFHDRLAAVTRSVALDRVGLDGLATTATMRRSSWASDDAHRFEAALAVDAAGRDVAAWVLEVPLRENLDTAYVELLDSSATDPDGGSEVHRALVEDVLAAVRRHGRTVVFAHEVIREIHETSFDPLVLEGAATGREAGLGAGSGTGLGAGPGTGLRDRYTVIGPEGASAADLIPVRSGAGRVSPSDGWVRRMLEAGFEPVQVARMAVLDVSAVGEVRDLPDRTLPHGARTVSWVDGTPEEWAAQMADLYSVFERTVPTGGAAFAPEVWDVARLRETEETARATGIVRIVSAVAHEDRLLAFTLFEQTPGSPIVFQEHTVVRPEARGRGLAVLVKRANAEHLARVSPDARTVCTWNAVENLPMIAVNSAAGFVPHAFSVLWEARLAEDAAPGS